MAYNIIDKTEHVPSQKRPNLVSPGAEKGSKRSHDPFGARTHDPKVKGVSGDKWDNES